MNDAVESFLVFHNARMTGEYRADYKGKISASMSFEDSEYILVVRQGESVVTIFFEDLLTDVHLYDYGEIGHFWVKEYEYLRQLEYRLAIMRDKYDYLGEEYCTSEEQKLAMLVDFPPLNYCCYPAVPEQYIVPRIEPWVPTEEAIAVMEELAVEADDKGLQKILKIYRKHPNPHIAKKIAAMLHRNAHAEVVDLLNERLKKAVSGYRKRSYGEEMDAQCLKLLLKVKNRQQKLQKRRKRISCFKRGTFRDCKGQHRLSDSSDDMGKRNPESKSENRELFVRKRIILWHTENLPPATSLAYFGIKNGHPHWIPKRKKVMKRKMIYINSVVVFL